MKKRKYVVMSFRAVAGKTETRRIGEYPSPEKAMSSCRDEVLQALTFDRELNEKGDRKLCFEEDFPLDEGHVFPDGGIRLFRISDREGLFEAAWWVKPEEESEEGFRSVRGLIDVAEREAKESLIRAVRSLLRDYGSPFPLAERPCIRLDTHDLDMDMTYPEWYEPVCVHLDGRDADGGTVLLLYRDAPEGECRGTCEYDDPLCALSLSDIQNVLYAMEGAIRKPE